MAQPEERVVWRKSSRTVKTRRSWMSKERSCRGNCETLRSSRAYRRKLQSGLQEGLQQQLQDTEEKRHYLLPERQRVQKRSRKMQSIQDKKRNLQKENVAAREEMRKLKEDVKQKEERVLFSVGQSREK